MFVGVSELEEQFFADKLNLYVAVGPVSKIPNTDAAGVDLATTFYEPLADAVNLFNVYEVGGQNWLTEIVVSDFCVAVVEFCEWVTGFFTNSKTDLDDDDRYAVYMGHEPNGGTVQSLLHYAQNIREDRFQMWAPDYTDFVRRGKKRQTPLIPLDSVNKVPVAIFCGYEDILADCTDAEWTRDEIGDKVVHFEKIHAGHLSFLVGKDMTYWTEGVMGLL
jgi:hypothetical protein